MPPPPPGQPSFPTAPGPGQGPHPSYPTAASPSGFGAGPVPQPGGFVGPYRIVRELAAGGMGVVYVAQHPSLNRQVALKLMRAGAGPNEVERFRIEAQASARLTHPHIVAVHDVGIAGGQPYLVMDLIAGRSLKDVIRDDGPLDPVAAATLLAKLARAMSYSHTRSILHRDIKPHNVLINGEGEPLLTDFGLAKDVSTQDQGLTVSGQVVGTPAYMPPEQAEGELDRVDRRADIYSLGATLYEMLVGKPAFAGATTANILFQVLTKEPTSPRKHDPTIDRDLETICLKCLEKEPEARYLTALALAEDLERYLDDEPIEARPIGVFGRLARTARRNRRVVQISSVLVVGVLVAGFFQAQHNARRERENAASSQLAAEAAKRAEAEAGKRAAKEKELKQVNGRIGDLASARSDLERGYGLMAQGRVDDALSFFIKTADRVNGIDGGPGEAGQRLLDAARRAAQVGVGTLGRELRVAESPTHPGDLVVAWGKGLAAYAFAVRGAGALVHIVDPDSGTTVRSFRSRFPKPLSLQFSPDGRSLALVCLDGSRKRAELVLVDPRTGNPRWPPRSLEGAYRRGVLRFSPDGGTLLVPSVDPLLLDPATGRERHVLRSDLRKPGHRANACSSSFDGANRLVVGYDDGTVAIWNATTGRPMIPFLNVHPVRYKGAVNAAVWVSPHRWDGANLLTGAADGRVRLWAIPPLLPERFRAKYRPRMPSHALVKELHRGGSGGVECYAFDRERSAVAVGFEDGRVRLFEAGWSGTQVLEVGPAVVRTLSMDPDGLHLLTGQEGVVDMWDLRLSRRIQSNRRLGTLVAFGSKDTLVMVGEGNTQTATSLSTARYLFVAGVAQANRSRHYKIGEHDFYDAKHVRVTGLAVTPDDRYAIVSADCDQNPRENWIRVFDLSNGARVAELKQEDVETLSVVPDGRAVLAGRRTGGRTSVNLPYLCQVDELALPALARRKTYTWHVAGITDISARGEWFSTASEDGTVAVWRRGGAKPERIHRPGPGAADGRTTTAVGGDAPRDPAAVRAWWSRVLGEERTPASSRYASEGVYACDISERGAQVLTGSANGALRWWTPEHRGAQGIATSGPARVVLARFATPELIVTASGQEVRVWDAFEGRTLRVLRTEHPIVSAAVSPDGRWVAASLLEGVVQLWSIAGTPLEGFSTNPLQSVQAASFPRVRRP